jgi:hypothetical protein
MQKKTAKVELTVQLEVDEETYDDYVTGTIIGTNMEEFFTGLKEKEEVVYVHISVEEHDGKVHTLLYGKKEVLK